MGGWSDDKTGSHHHEEICVLRVVVWVHKVLLGERLAKIDDTACQSSSTWACLPSLRCVHSLLIAPTKQLGDIAMEFGEKAKADA